MLFLIFGAILLFDNPGSKGKYWPTGQNTKLQVNDPENILKSCQTGECFGSRTLIMYHFRRRLLLLPKELKSNDDQILKFQSDQRRIKHSIRYLPQDIIIGQWRHDILTMIFFCILPQGILVFHQPLTIPPPFQVQKLVPAVQPGCVLSCSNLVPSCATRSESPRLPTARILHL